MTQLAWSDQVAALNGMLDTLQARVADGNREASGLEEFKSALDDLRLRAWSLLTAINSDDPHGFQERFRTRRGTEMCRSLGNDLRTAKLSGSQPDLPALGAAARELAAAVKEAVPKAPRKRRKA